MLVGVLSDTHDRLPTIRAALELFAARGVEAVVHPGDFVAPFAVRALLEFDAPLHVTFGNNDGERKGLTALMPQVQDGPLLIELGGRTVLVHHFIDWCEPADIDRADIIVTGHTHEVDRRVEGGKLFLNPGECCGWVTGKCTAAILDTATLSVEICEIAQA